MKYILYKDGSGLCKTREGELLSRFVTLQFISDGSEIRLGISKSGANERFYSITNGSAIIPSSAFFEGENQITVYGKSKLWKCEALNLQDNIISPVGCDSTEQIVIFKSEYERLQKRISICESQIAELTKSIDGAKLFK